MADGTKFFFKAALAILRLTEAELLPLDFSEINEYFKSFINEKDSSFKLLPDHEKIITEAYKFKITDEQVEQICKSFDIEDGQQADESIKVQAHTTTLHHTKLQSADSNNNRTSIAALGGVPMTGITANRLIDQNLSVAKPLDLSDGDSALLRVPNMLITETPQHAAEESQMTIVKGAKPKGGKTKKGPGKKIRPSKT